MRTGIGVMSGVASVTAQTMDEIAGPLVRLQVVPERLTR